MDPVVCSALTAVHLIKLGWKWPADYRGALMEALQEAEKRLAPGPSDDHTRVFMLLAELKSEDAAAAAAASKRAQEEAAQLAAAKQAEAEAVAAKQAAMEAAAAKQAEALKQAQAKALEDMKKEKEEHEKLRDQALARLQAEAAAAAKRKAEREADMQQAHKKARPVAEKQAVVLLDQPTQAHKKARPVAEKQAVVMLDQPTQGPPQQPVMKHYSQRKRQYKGFSALLSAYHAQAAWEAQQELAEPEYVTVVGNSESFQVMFRINGVALVGGKESRYYEVRDADLVSSSN